MRTALAGNLCRCTAIEPILAAGRSIDSSKMRRLSDHYPLPSMSAELAECREDSILIDTGPRFFSAPPGWPMPSQLRVSHPGEVITAGATELGVDRNRRGVVPSAVLSLAGIGELAKIELDDKVLTVGQRT